jgi:hypothetical protein
MRGALCLFFVACANEPAHVFVATTAAPPPQATTTAFVVHVSAAPATCGEAVLRRAELVALGKGANHPDVMVVDARLKDCPDAKPSADECLVVVREHVELEARGYGARHPYIIANDAKRALCP